MVEIADIYTLYFPINYKSRAEITMFQDFLRIFAKETCKYSLELKVMKEINYKDMKFNPFNLIGDEWMLVTAGNEQKCNTMTASWGHLGCLWGHNDPTAVIYLRPSRYTKEFVDEESYFSLCVMDKSFKKQMAYLGSVSGRDEDKISVQEIFK